MTDEENEEIEVEIMEFTLDEDEIDELIAKLVELKDTTDIRKLVGLEMDEILQTSLGLNYYSIQGYKNQLLDALYSAKFSLFEDSEKVINRLSNKYNLAIVSNVYLVTNDRLRETFPEFISKFDIVTFSSEIGIKKPNKEIFIQTLNQLNNKKGTHIIPQDIKMILNRR